MPAVDTIHSAGAPAVNLRNSRMIAKLKPHISPFAAPTHTRKPVSQLWGQIGRFSRALNIRASLASKPQIQLVRERLHHMPTAFNRHSLFSPFLNRGRGLSQELGDFFPPFQSCGLGLGLRHQGQAGPELFCLSLAATFSGARRLHEEYDAIQLRCHISLRPHYSTYLISRVPAPGEPIANGHK